tara:strand:+ start:3927 stop:4454 length:528 start_codon:yes stop_codon:yes gene_type:complete
MINDEFRIEYQFIAGFLVPIKYQIEKVVPMNRETFVTETLAHYEARLAEEKERFGVIMVSDALIEHHSHVICSDAAGDMWAEISKSLVEEVGLRLHVDGLYGDPQGVFAILSKEVIPRPQQYHMLWQIVAELKDEDLDLDEKIETLVYYDGPYKVEVPFGITKTALTGEGLFDEE